MSEAARPGNPYAQAAKTARPTTEFRYETGGRAKKLEAAASASEKPAGVKIFRVIPRAPLGAVDGEVEILPITSPVGRKIKPIAQGLTHVIRWDDT